MIAPMADLPVDEQCLALAEHCLQDSKWTDKDRLSLAHAVQQLVQEFMETFGSEDPEKR